MIVKNKIYLTNFDIKAIMIAFIVFYIIVFLICLVGMIYYCCWVNREEENRENHV